MNYLYWKEKKIKDFSPENISNLYENGFVFTRIDRGIMHQTRSARIDIEKFEFSSENRRILKKIEKIKINEKKIPYEDYSWEIGKMAKDFYDSRGVRFGVSRIKKLIIDEGNFNTLLKYYDTGSNLGYTICYKNEKMLHYSYPFYDINKSTKDMGLGMMTKAILYAKEKKLKYIYLGSLQRQGDTYKLQFANLEWFDGKNWSKDTKKVKMILNESK